MRRNAEMRRRRSLEAMTRTFARGGRRVAGVGLALAVMSGGCVRTRVENSLVGVSGSSDLDAEFKFWDGLAQRPVVSNDDGLHGLFLFADGDDPAKSYKERLDAARVRGWVGSDWDEPGDLAMQRGVLARAVAVHCKIEGGVMMQVLGPVPRYATRELQYLGMMGSGSEQQAVSGREYMGVLAKSQDYLLLGESGEQAGGAKEGEEGSSEPGGEPPAAKSAPPVPRPGADAPGQHPRQGVE
jgi:hypothetical protein